MSATLTSSTGFKVAFGAWWFTWAELHFIALRNFGSTPAEAITDSLISTVLLAACGLLISTTMKYYLPRKERFWYIMIVSGALSLIWFIITHLTLKNLFSSDENYISTLNHSTIVRYP